MCKTLSLVSFLLFVTHFAHSQQWQNLGSSLNSNVHSVEEYEGDVYIGGNFTHAGVQELNGVARLNGTSWEPLGSGITMGLVNVNDMIEYEGKLVVAGSFIEAGGLTANNIAQWDGNSWEVLGTGVSGTVYDLQIYNGDLFVAGNFDSAGTIAADLIARWNGIEWFSLATTNLVADSITEMEVYDGHLYVIGAIDSVNGIAANSIARWSEFAWNKVGEGLPDRVNDLISLNGVLLAGTTLELNHELVPFWWTYAWDGIDWTVYADSGHARTQSMTIANGALVAGVGSPSGNCYPLDNFVRYWSGGDWKEIGTEINGYVNEVDVIDGVLYAVGHFNQQAGCSLSYVASYRLPVGINVPAYLVNVFRISPNPTKGLLYVNSITPMQSIEIVNLQGQLILEENSACTQQTEYVVDLRSVETGVYIVKVQFEGGHVEVQKVVRE